ncbi:MAG TPA: CopG family transcriptional regulator [Gaiellaceae bacterium]|nr:CopG family transcriptional regulator [Gaiellaceae bacterium]
MKRTSVMLPDDVAARLRYEARRRGQSTAALVREAVEQYLPSEAKGRTLSFFAIGRSGMPDGSERVDEIVGDAIEESLRGD